MAVQIKRTGGWRKKNADYARMYAWITDFIAENGYPPSMMEIRDGLSLSSVSVVKYSLDRLAELGYIKRMGGPRTIVVLGPPEP